MRAFLLGLAGVVIVVVVGFLVWAKTGVMPAEGPPVSSVMADPRLTILDRGEALIMNPAGVAAGGATDAAVGSVGAVEGDIAGLPSGLGLVFIPGAKVEAGAYLYKLSGLVVEDGWTVIITKPLLNLAVVDLRALRRFTDGVPEISTWYVGGHSLGGVRACLYARRPDVQGLILFGSYCANDLSSRDLPVLSIGGSEDGLSTPQKIAASANRLPADTTFVEIDGANHAGFGNYGRQAGDGQATIGNEQIRAAITNRVRAFLRGEDAGRGNP